MSRKKKYLKESAPSPSPFANSFFPKHYSSMQPLNEVAETSRDDSRILCPAAVEGLPVEPCDVFISLENNDVPVLIVDDNIFNQVTIQAILEMQFNIKCQKANNGLEATQMIE